MAMKPIPPVFWSAPRTGAPPIRYSRRALERSPGSRPSPFMGPGPGYAQNDPNSFPQDLIYSERIVFGRGDRIDLASSGMPAAAVTADARTETPSEAVKRWINKDHFVVIPLPSSNDALAVAVLPYNESRVGLIIQNQDPAANLYFSFSSPVSLSGTAFVGVLLAPGQGYAFDNDSSVPSDALYTAWDTTPTVGGIVSEGTRGDVRTIGRTLPPAVIP